MKEKTNSKRRQFSRKERESHVEGWISSGLSANAYGKQIGVRAGNLIRWRHNGSTTKSDSTPTFRELSFHGDDTGATSTNSQPSGSLLDVCLPSGARLLVHQKVEANWLNGVIYALSEVQK